MLSLPLSRSLAIVLDSVPLLTVTVQALECCLGKPICPVFLPVVLLVFLLLCVLEPARLRVLYTRPSDDSTARSPAFIVLFCLSVGQLQSEIYDIFQLFFAWLERARWKTILNWVELQHSLTYYTIGIFPLFLDWPNFVFCCRFGLRLVFDLNSNTSNAFKSIMACCQTQKSFFIQLFLGQVVIGS